MADQTYVQVRFSFPAADGYPEYADALMMSLSDFQTANVADFEIQKIERHTNWKAVLDEARNAPEPTHEEQITQLLERYTDACIYYASLVQERDNIEGQIEALGESLDVDMITIALEEHGVQVDDIADFSTTISNAVHPPPSDIMTV